MPLSINTTGGTALGGFSITTDFSQIRRNVGRLRKELRDRTEPLTTISRDYMAKKVIKSRFDKEGVPRWKKLAPKTIKFRKYKNRKILQQTGSLKSSATGGVAWQMNLVPSSNPKDVTFGSSLDYAFIHDQPRGTMSANNIPGRPWSQVTQTNIDESARILMKWVEKKIKLVGAT